MFSTSCQFVEMRAKEFGVSVRWEGEGVDEIGIVESITGDSA